MFLCRVYCAVDYTLAIMYEEWTIPAAFDDTHCMRPSNDTDRDPIELIYPGGCGS